MIKEVVFVTLALVAITSAYPAEEPQTGGAVLAGNAPAANLEELETAETAYRRGGIGRGGYGGGHGGHHGGGHYGGGHYGGGHHGGGHHGGHHGGGYGK